MWLCTKRGFFSIVRKAGTDKFQIRARCREDLMNLQEALGLPRAAILRTPTADYRYRMIVGLGTVLRVMDWLVSELDYTNFKGEIATRPDQRAKLNAYHDFWHSMFQMQDR